MLKEYKYTKLIRVWLIVGLIMLIGQVILGGITRLTGSGLSITRWDIITGIIPPYTKGQWVELFELYRQTPQFQQINSSFTIKDFKFIYFWEYFHRLWVRVLGIIFAIPFIIFVIQKKINIYLIKRLFVVVVLAALTASAGWIMVQSGLVDKPWVNAYKLTLHFILAILTIGAMVRTIADVYNFENKTRKNPSKFALTLLIFTFLQLILAALMSGMKAGIYYHTWPLMNGQLMPSVLLDPANWTWHNMTNYDTFTFAPALVHFLHRLVAYILFSATIFFYFKKRNTIYTRGIKWITGIYTLIIFQLFFGILLLLKIKTGIPIFFGVIHQLTGLLYFISLLFLYYSLRPKQI